MTPESLFANAVVLGPLAPAGDASVIETVRLFAAVFALVFVINVVPAFMPPTWSVLAFFLIHDHLPLVPLAVGGAVASSAGRVVLALGSRWLGPRVLSRQQQEGLRHLGRWLETRARWAAPAAVLAFSFTPIPSNEVFIAAGVAHIKLWPIVAAFFVGRVVSYYVLALGAHAAVDRLEDVFSVSGQGVAALAIQLAALGLLVVLAKIDWVKLLHLPET